MKMNNLDLDYQNLLQDILDNGVKKETRNGGTISVFGRQIRHDMKIGFPLLTTKKMAWKTMVTELLWFLRGDSDIRFLWENNCSIWDGDWEKNYKTTCSEPYTIEEVKQKVKGGNHNFHDSMFDMGPIYGKQWRNLNSTKSKQRFFDKSIPYDRFVDNRDGIDQIANLINDLKTNPDSRRILVSAWNPSDLPNQVLPPCHYGFQVYTRELSGEERFEKWWVEYFNTPVDYIHSTYAMDIWEKEHSKSYPTRAISLMWNQRSVDTPLGLPFNIASYGLLLEIIAKTVNMVPDELIGNLGDCHIYLNQVDGVKEQIGRELSLEERYELMKNLDNWISVHYKEPKSMEYMDKHNIPTRTREPYPLPTLKHMKTDEFYKALSEDLTLLTHLDNTDFVVENYQSHPSIKMPLSN
jgi:thymidylate synthase